MAKDNAVNDESLVRTVQRNFYIDDFLKSARIPQEAIEIYQKVKDILIKCGLNLTKCITSAEEVKSKIPEADRSTKVVKNFEAEPQSSSILGLNSNVDTDSLLVCRWTEQEVPAKLTQRIVLSFVSAVLDPLGICSLFTIRMRLLLKSIWAAMGQAWDKELSAEHSKIFKDWCSDLREIRTMPISRLYFENGYTNLGIHIFTDASEEAMWIVAHLQDETTLKLTYVIGKCRVALVRNTTIPKLELQAAVYGVRVRRQILREQDVKIDKILDRLIYSLTVVTVSSQETASVFCQQGSVNTGKFFHGPMETCQRHRKPSRYWHKRDVHRRPQGLQVVKRAGMAPDRRRKEAKAMMSREPTWTRSSYQYCSNKNKTRPTIWLETKQYLQPN